MTITVAVICLTVTCTTLAAPVQVRTNSDLALLKTQLLIQSIVGQAFIQQEESLSSEDKQKAVMYCKLITSLINYIQGCSIGDYCTDVDLPPHEDNLEDTYENRENLLNVLKNLGLENILDYLG